MTPVSSRFEHDSIPNFVHKKTIIFINLIIFLSVVCHFKSIENAF